jgi:exopolyphosphatase/guanosine-5'-triphosphate,3'-diphosphate pyrophosphatase
MMVSPNPLGVSTSAVCDSAAGPEGSFRGSPGRRSPELGRSYADMPGFSRNEQQLLAFVVRAQRRKFPEEELALLPASARDRATKLAVLFRLACVLNRGRSTEALPLFTLEPSKNRLTLSLSAVWLDASPLIRMELDAERERLTAAGIELTLRVA